MNFQVIYPKDVETVVKKEHAILLDLRPREIYEREHWPGAGNYPFETAEQWERLLPKKRLVILYCQHGGSSMQLASRLGGQGYRMASVVGGYEAMKKYAKSSFQNGKIV
jgi:thiosulfate sulfurtransferase